MAVQDEIFRIRYQAEGENAIKRAQAELAKLEANSDKLVSSLRSGVRNQEEFAKGAEIIAQKLAKARVELAAYQRLAAQSANTIPVQPAAPAPVNRSVADVSMRRTGSDRTLMALQPGAFDDIENKGARSTRNLGMAALEAGRALEDLNFGLIGVMNNIPQLALALGAGMGLTGVIATLGAAVLFLSRNWSTVTDVLKVGVENDTISSLERAKTELEEIDKALDAIAKKPRISIAEKIRVGTLRTQREDLQRQLDESEALDSLFGRQSDREREVGKIVSDAVANSGIERAAFGSLLTRGIEGIGGVERAGFGRGTNPTAAARQLLANASGGDESAARTLARVLGAAGGQGAGLASGILGALDPSAYGSEVGPTRRELEEGRQRQEQERQRANELARQADKATAESRKISTDAAFAGILGVDSRVDQGLRNRLGSGRSLQAAGAEVAAGLSKELQDSGGLPQDWADEEAKKYVDARAKALREGAARQALSPDSAALDDLGLMRAQLALAGLGGSAPRGPSVLSAESFAASVQAGGAKSPTDLMKEQLDKAEQMLRINAEIRDILERRGLLGA